MAVGQTADGRNGEEAASGGGCKLSPQGQMAVVEGERGLRRSFVVMAVDGATPKALAQTSTQKLITTNYCMIL